MTACTPVLTSDRHATEQLDVAPRFTHRGSPDLSDEPAGWYLVVEHEERRLIPVPDGATHIGRGFRAGIHLDDHTVSRSHAVIVQRPTGLRILDDRSANGTFVNGRRIDEAVLGDGDVVVLGRVVLTVRDRARLAAGVPTAA